MALTWDQEKVVRQQFWDVMNMPKSPAEAMKAAGESFFSKEQMSSCCRLEKLLDAVCPNLEEGTLGLSFERRLSGFPVLKVNSPSGALQVEPAYHGSPNFLLFSPDLGSEPCSSCSLEEAAGMICTMLN